MWLSLAFISTWIYRSFQTFCYDVINRNNLRVSHAKIQFSRDSTNKALNEIGNLLSVRNSRNGETFYRSSTFKWFSFPVCVLVQNFSRHPSAFAMPANFIKSLFAGVIGAESHYGTVHNFTWFLEGEVCRIMWFGISKRWGGELWKIFKLKKTVKKS